ncbi:MAG TPA: NAD(P)H-dependent glycerol-3-phosphate dehydrogenase [bacterium]|nr:NAD(P)H-dependent glycerol-3-phosphate dehydrogenase [bacterium]HOL47688.1 NAD(P)H-dependent glycerol-3-phosphate dehydrogenase [bacterium]HPQ18712.1 NAD(P)H-dependent glycerol-3-phosphate dehydrogenase [bacterium]
MKILVIGCGAWGKTIIKLLLENKTNFIYVYDINIEQIKNIEKKNKNKIVILQSLSEILNLSFDLILLIIPFKFLRETIIQIKPFYKEQIVVNLSKGIEHKYFLTGSMIVENILKTDKIVSLTGPTHTEEVEKKIPSAVVAASKNINYAKQIQRLFNRDYFRVYTTTDIIGAELGGAVKNVIALAAGISDGLGFGTNTKAALLTRGIYEIVKLSKIFNCQIQTFYGLSGIGDLMTTAFSKYSRNRNFGELIGKGYSVDDALKKIKQVVEGYYTVKTIKQISQKYKIEFPISNEVYKILYENKEPYISVKALMTRKLKNEI